jgi:ATP-dependent Clp protease ATP-binding subunit ClpC
MFQNYVQKSTKKVLRTLEIAIAELVGQKQNVLTPDFVLVALLSQSDSETVQMIERTAPSPAETIATIKGQIHHHYKAAAPVQEHCFSPCSIRPRDTPASFYTRPA